MQLKKIVLSDIIFVVVMFMLIVLSIISYQTINNLRKEADLFNHTHQVKLTLEQMLSHVNDVETSERIFLITKDSSYLELYTSALGNTRTNLQTLDSLISDDPMQQLHFSNLSSLINQRLSRPPIAPSAFDKMSLNLNALFAEEKKNIREIRTLVANMILEEDVELENRKIQRNRIAFLTPLYSMLLSVFAILIIAAAYLVLKRQFRLRSNAQHGIKKLSDFFRGLPAVFAILKGPAHLHELVNPYYETFSMHSDCIGKSFRSAFPEFEGLGLFESMDEAYRSGLPAIQREVPVTRQGESGSNIIQYFNFIFQPIAAPGQGTEGLLLFAYDITEMITARNQVKEMELRSRLAIEAANIGTYDWDMENNVFLSSPRLLEIFGYQPTNTEVTHLDLIARFHPDDKPIRDEAVASSYHKGALSYEVRLIWDDQTIHWVSVYGKTIHSGSQASLRMYGTVIDVTKQKKVLAELQESEATFRLLADSLPQFVWMADVRGHLVYCNHATYNYLGLDEKTLLEGGGFDTLHPDEREQNLARWEDSVATGTEFSVEHRIKNAWGDYRWHHTRALPQKDGNGVIQRWIGSTTDIDAQKNESQQLELQIRERTTELRALNKSLLIQNNIFTQAEENAQIGSYSWQLATGELEYSDNLFRLFGFEPQEFIPSFDKYHSLIHPDDLEQVMKDGAETLRTRKLTSNVYRIITKSGNVRHFRSSGKFFGEEPNVMLIGTVQDITQDTMLNEILRVKNIELQHTNAELESFNYIASHDLQEPLRKIQAFSQRIIQKEGHLLSTLSQDYFSRINASAARMQNLINALLNYSRADISTSDIKPVDLMSVMEQVTLELQDTIEQNSAHVSWTGLPTIPGISMQVQQLMINLVSNAVKYHQPGRPPIIVISATVVKGGEVKDAAAEAKLSYWKIDVKDNGIGFEQEYEHKIFELFQRLHSKEDYMGTGIGLAICKKIIRNHQGFIRAKGEPGVGAVFSVYFPVSS